MKKISIEIDDVRFSLLEVLTKSPDWRLGESVEQVISRIVDHVAQGIYRPGSWERGWLIQVAGDDFCKHLEAGDPWAPFRSAEAQPDRFENIANAVFQRPVTATDEWKKYRKEEMPRRRRRTIGECTKGIR